MLSAVESTADKSMSCWASALAKAVLLARSADETSGRKILFMGFGLLVRYWCKGHACI